MNSISRLCKKVLLLTIIVATLFTAISVKASEVPSTISMLSKSSSHYFSGSTAYINGYKFYFKKTSDGVVSYCSGSANMKYPGGINLTLKGEADKGLDYIINNGYPAKSLTGDGNKDYYITQSAIWLYFDKTRGQNSWNGYDFSSFQEGTMEYYVNTLANGAINALNSTVNETPSISLSIDNNDFTVANEYNVSGLITVNVSNNDGNYTVALTNAPEGTIIQSENGEVKNSFTNGEKFRVYVLASASFEKISIKVTTNKTTYKSYEYTSGNSAYQDIITTTKYPSVKTVEGNLDLVKVAKSQVSISKQDITNKQELPGASLVLKDESGNVIDTWVSTTTPHYINNLSKGKYILSETIAPQGYELTTETITFEINEDGSSKMIIMYNTPYIEVPATALNASSIIVVAGVILSLFGMGLVFKNVKEKE